MSAKGGTNKGGTKKAGSASLRLARGAASIRADLSIALFDVLITVGGYAAVLTLRFEGQVPSVYWERFLRFLPIAVVVHLASNYRWGLYRQLWHHASVYEARRIVLAGLSSSLVILVLPIGPRVPFSVRLLGMVVVVAGMGALRFQSRLFAFQRRDKDDEQTATRVVVIGAGQAGAAILRDMLRKPSAFEPVAVLDDDPRKHGHRLLGVPVVGPIGHLPAIVLQREATEALLAIPSANQDVVKRAVDAADGADVPLRILPGVTELVQGRVSLRDVRDLRIEDLLGRQQVETDRRAVEDVLRGKRVLITGAGGSIGSEISRQVAACVPDELVLLDNDETHLHDVVTELPPGAISVLADIRDARRVTEVFSQYRPEIVFHAAAHKHVPLLEAHPCEAVATNVVGTKNVVSAAAGIASHLVFISTDKAVQPASIMGASKRVGEQLVLAHARPGARWCAVRFGNVLGSRGSVIPTFIRQIRAGGPVTVTDARMTRFFMSTEEAVQLVLQAAALAEGREAFMLDMGEPVKIMDLAARMIQLSGHHVGTDVEIEVTGIRPGEKLEEQLRAPEEEPFPTLHPSIVRLYPTTVPAVDLDHVVGLLGDLARRGEQVAAGRMLLDLAGGSDPAEAVGRILVPDDVAYAPDGTYPGAGVAVERALRS